MRRTPMAHDLAFTNGQPAIMFAGEVPWHGLGTRLDNPVTSRQAIEAAGLDYELRLSTMVTADGFPVPKRKAVVRDDTGVVLGVVGDRFVPVQNSEAFGFLDTIVADGGLKYHTAGALGRGERVWMLAKLPCNMRVRGSDDVIERFLLLSNAHDGTAALRVLFTPIRVVCSNTLSLAHRNGRGEGVTVRHVGDIHSKVRQAQEVLGLAHRFYDDLEGMIDRLASHYPTAAQLDLYFRSLYPDPVDGSNGRARNTREELFRLFERGRGQDIPQVRHTTWAAYNAVTEFVDHGRTPRGSNPGEKATRRLDSIWFGSGAAFKSRAFDAAVRLAADN
jgi:phage/plasmid-like protein (TIGR03299 family)